MADEPHAVAVIALLEADPAIPAVYDDTVPADAPTAYVKVYFHRMPSQGDNLNEDTTDVDMLIYVHSVAATSAGARIVARNVEASLLDVAPAVAGRSCWRIEWVDGLPEPVRDETTGRQVLDQVDTYRLRSTTG